MKKKHLIIVLSLMFVCAIFMVLKIKVLDNYQIEKNTLYDTAFIIKDNQIIDVITSNKFFINPNTNDICRFDVSEGYSAFSDFSTGNGNIIHFSRKIYVKTKEPSGTVNQKLQQPIEVVIHYLLQVKDMNDFVKYLHMNKLCNESSQSTNRLIKNELINNKLKLNNELDRITNETLQEYSYKEIKSYQVAFIREIFRKFNPVISSKTKLVTLYDMRFDNIISYNPNDQPEPKNELDLNVKIKKGIY